MQELEKPLAKDEAFVFMGHGTEHFANSAYSQFENMLRDLGHESTYVGTVEGFPSLDYVIRRLKIREITNSEGPEAAILPPSAKIYMPVHVDIFLVLKFII